VFGSVPTTGSGALERDGSGAVRAVGAFIGESNFDVYRDLAGLDEAIATGMGDGLFV
jgi:hypothetical protein